MEDGDVFTAFVSAPAVMPSNGTAAVSAEGSRSRSGRTYEQVHGIVDRLLNEREKISASEVSEKVEEVGERTVRRYLAAMVEEGLLETAKRGRSTVYWRPRKHTS